MRKYEAVVGEPVKSKPDVLALSPGKNLRTGTTDFAEIYADITTLEADVLQVASAIYACDLAFKRGKREQITRSVELTVPVVNYQAFKNRETELEILLWTLSHDNWTVRFRRSEGSPEAARQWTLRHGRTILFSGGVDSFTGAVELAEKYGAATVQLASHVTANLVTRSTQDTLAEYIKRKIGEPSRITVRTGGWTHGGMSFPSEREDTQRTRSFMFLAIGALAARRSGHSELLFIAENGQMAIHLPLSRGRIGAFSTHTAHPDFVRQATDFFTGVLDFELRITNPYVYLTKAEVVSRVVQKHASILPKSVSCWRSARIGGEYDHCGQCVPCIIRRIAFEYNGIKVRHFERDLFAEDVPRLPETDDGKRNLVEIIEFAYLFDTKSDGELDEMFIDLTSSEIDKTEAIAMYKRFAREAMGVLREYPGCSALLGLAPQDHKKKHTKGKSR